MKEGRPTKYDPKYCDLAIQIIGDEGKSITQFARDIRVSKSTVYLWAEVHQEFSDALTLARDWAEAHWEDKFMDFMVNRDANAPLVKLYYANRFKWTDKQEHEPQQDLADALAKLADKLPG